MEQDLQVENGKFTRIVNPLIMELVKVKFKGCGLAVILYIIRKTYGFQKKTDKISLSQFTKDLGRSRNTIISALKEVQDMNIVVLVKQGNNTGECNEWMINKYFNTWKLVQHTALVQHTELVQSSDKPSAVEAPNLVQQSAHTKEITKEITKETIMRFEDFWLIYPKKVGKQKCNELWNKICEEDRKLIKEDIPKRLKDRKWTEGFIKDPERYIKSRQWEDEIIQGNKKTDSLKVNTGKYDNIKRIVIDNTKI